MRRSWISRGGWMKSSSWIRQSTKLQKKKLNSISVRRIQRFSEWWLERNTFENVYKIQWWRCIFTNRLIEKENAICYAHILNKWAYQHLRLKENNIVLVYDEKHHKILDKIIKILKNKIWRDEIEKRIMNWETIIEDILGVYNQL